MCEQPTGKTPLRAKATQVLECLFELRRALIDATPLPEDYRPSAYPQARQDHADATANVDRLIRAWRSLLIELR